MMTVIYLLVILALLSATVVFCALVLGSRADGANERLAEKLRSEE